MKLIRTAKVLLVLALALALAGCFDAGYFFSFAEEQDTGNSEGEWILQGEGLSGINDYGVYANGICLTAPLKFSGDFTATADFWLGMTAEFPGYLKVALADVPLLEGPADWMEVEFLSLGTLDEALKISDGHGTDIQSHVDQVGEVKSLNKTHWNKLAVNKKGDRITITVNGRRLAAFDLAYCSAAYLTLNFLSGSDSVQDPADPVLGFILKDVKVDYMEGSSAPVV